MWKDCLSSRCERFHLSVCLGRCQCDGPCVGVWANVAAGFGYERELPQSIGSSTSGPGHSRQAV